MNNVLLISEDYIKSESNLDNNISGKYLQPAIKLAQDVELQSLIGTKLLRRIQELVMTDKIEDEEYILYKELLDSYIQPFLLFQVLSEIIIPVSFKIGNVGLIRAELDRTSYSVMSEVELIKQHYQNKADFYKTRLQDWVITYHSKFPELSHYKPLKDMFPNLYSASSCGVWLGGARGKGERKDIGRLRRLYDFPTSK